MKLKIKEWRWLVYAIFFVCSYLFDWFKVLSFFFGHRIVDCGFIINVSTVAIAVNGVSTIVPAIKNSLTSSDQNARDAFLAYTLDLLAKLSCENKNKEKLLTEIQDRPVKYLNSEELTGIASTKEKIDKNKARIKVLQKLVQQARYAKIETSRTPEKFERNTFIFVCISILVLISSPQITKYQIHNSLFLVLFLPQFDLLCRWGVANIRKFFPLKYLILVWKTQETIGEKIGTVCRFEKSVWTFKPEAKDQISQNMGSITSSQ